MWLSGQGDNELFTNTYTVPPTFLQGHSEQGWQPRDPFAEFQPSVPRKTAKEILEGAGITFNAGCSAIYNPSTSQLIFRNTQDQMELVEAYIDSIRSGVEKQIYLTFREFSLDEKQQDKAQEVGFDWLIGPPESLAVPAGRRRSLNSYQAFLQELSRPPVVVAETNPVAQAVAGVFTDPQYQVMYRALEKKFPSSIDSLPSVMVRSGQPGLVQVGERRYGAIATLGADEFTIDLSVFLPEHGKALFQPGDDLHTPLQVTIWDGQVVALSVSSEDGIRTVFLKAQIMDPAGMPINPEGGQEAEKAEEKESKEPAVSFAPYLNETDKLKVNETEEELDVNATIQSMQETWRASLPKGSSHLVLEGETLYGIATDANTSVSELRELNRLDSDYIEEGQVILVPGVGNGVPGLESILRSTIIPSVEFDDTPLVEALGFVHRVLLSETSEGLFPSPVPKLVFKDSGDLASTRITLRLSNVPVNEALRYITSLAQYQYQIEGTRIMISPINSSEEE